MNVNRPGLRKRFHAAETVIGKKNPALFSWNEKAEAMTAGASARGDLNVGGKPVDRSAQGGADGFCDFCWYGYDSNGLHDVCPFLFSLALSGSPPFFTHVSLQRLRAALLSGIAARTKEEMTHGFG
jgi:hypothetical protein